MTNFIDVLLNKKPSYEKIEKNEVILGKKRVPITKITPAKWKKLFSVVDNLPGLIIQVFKAPASDYYVTIIQAFDIALDEIVKTVSLLTELDEDYITNHVGLDELVDYLAKMVELNRLDKTIKNMKSLLPKQ